MASFVSAEPLAFSLAIVTCHFSLAFFWKARQNDSGLSTLPLAQSRGKAQLAVTSYERRRSVSGGASRN